MARIARSIPTRLTAPTGVGAAAVVLALFCLAMLAATPVRGEPAGGKEATAEALKITFLWKFADWVGWPDGTFPDDDAPVVIGLVADDAFIKLLRKAIEGKTVQRRSISVRRLRPPTERPDDVADVPAFVKSVSTCHVVFVSASRKEAWIHVRDALTTRPILTVSDIKGFTDRDGMIGFVLKKDDTIGFRINRELAETRRLRIRSDLLRHAI